MPTDKEILDWLDKNAGQLTYSKASKQYAFWRHKEKMIPATRSKPTARQAIAAAMGK